MRTPWSSLVLSVPLVMLSVVAAQGQSAYRLPFSAMAAAGAPVASPAFHLNSTLGQPSPPGPQATDDLILQAGFWRAFVAPTTDVDSVAVIPAVTQVRQNFPNPFRGATTIRFALAAAQVVDISVYDLMGRRVKAVLREHRPAGEYTVTWTGSDEQGSRVAPGVYLCRFRAGSYGAVRKMVLVK
jgi:anti-sigma-K factor RskA